MEPSRVRVWMAFVAAMAFPVSLPARRAPGLESPGTRIEGTVFALATPGLRPDLPENPPEPRPVPSVRVVAEDEETGAGVAAVLTNDAGEFSMELPSPRPVTLRVLLEGPYAEVRTAQGDPVKEERTVTPPARVDVLLNPEPNEFSTAQVNGFIHAVEAHAFLKAHLPDFTALDEPVEVVTNHPLPCHGNYTFIGGKRTIRLSASSTEPGRPCANQAFSTIIYHEYGHAVVHGHYEDLGRIDLALSEGYSDAFAALLTGQPLIGGEGEGETALRDLSGPDLVFPDDAGSEPHRAGLIVGGAFWDAVVRLRREEGEEGGLETARRLFLRHMGPHIGGIGPEIFRAVIAADAGDGDPRNGTPHFGAIYDAFRIHGLVPPEVEPVRITTDVPPGRPRAPGGVPIEAEVVGLSAAIEGAVIRYRLNGGAFTEVALEPVDAAPGRYRGTIPGVPDAAIIDYYLAATAVDGRTGRSPAGAPLRALHHVIIGETERLFFDDFDGPERGWTHGAARGLDEWRRGPPGDGPYDPHQASSPPSIYGIDLGGLSDGNYRADSATFLDSPPIDCTHRSGVTIRFRRWLSVDLGVRDRARIRVNSTVVWESPTHAGIRDHEWTDQVLDVHRFADGNPSVTIRFELEAGPDRIVFGGWHIDDLEVIAAERPRALPFVRGDVDRDGTLDLRDAAAILLAAHRRLDLSCPDAADTDDDGEIATADVIRLLRFIFARGDPPADPFPVPSPDPTPDDLWCPGD